MRNSWSDNLPILLLALVLVVSAVHDITRQKIPNLLTYPTVLLALLFYGFSRGFDGILFSTSGLALGIGLLTVPYLMGGMGAGDVKLLGAVGAVLGPVGVFNGFLLTALVGGLYAGLLLMRHPAYSRGLFSRCTALLKISVASGTLAFALPNDAEKPKLYYGVAIALGTLCTIGWKLATSSFPFC